MTLNRWNWKTREYEPYEVPDGRRVAVYVPSMATVVDCASCGTSKPYGEMYTSREIHTPMGIGYSVCEECYEAECERRCKADVR